MEKYTIADIRRINKAKGGYFFSRDTMRMFHSRVISGVYHGATRHYFITGERHTSYACGSSESRLSEEKYTIREFNPATGDIRTAKDLDDYRKFSDLDTAREVARRLAKENKEQS